MLATSRNGGGLGPSCDRLPPDWRGSQCSSRRATAPISHKLTRDIAERLARNWWLLLLNGLLLIVAGVLIFSIDWSVRSLATFIGALFILEGVARALTSGIDARVARVNVLSGLLAMAAGIAIIVWPQPRSARGRDLPWRLADRLGNHLGQRRIRGSRAAA